MPLLHLEVSNFKSYRGHQTIGPFTQFTSIIGPNGAGKSNLMDAISFVLGIKSAQLRSSQLKDLVYRGRRAAKEFTQMDTQEEEEEEDDDEGEGDAKKAWVMAVYKDGKGKDWKFQRTISTAGASEYRLNDKTITYSAYTSALAQHSILVRAKNFLVFQGDVEAIASQSPIALSRLIDTISGAKELEGEYNKAKEELDEATRHAEESFGKRRGVAREVGTWKEMKDEASRFEALVQERDELYLHRVLFKLYHLEEKLEASAHFIRTSAKELVALKASASDADKGLEAARASQAEARAKVMQVDRKIKRTEKTLGSKKPDLISVETQIEHQERKMKQLQKTRSEVTRAKEDLEAKIARIRDDLERTKKMAEEAQEAARKASNANMALSEDALEEYRQLKAQASVLAVDERQSLESLSREAKTAERSVGQLSERQNGMEDKRNNRAKDLEAEETKKSNLDEHIKSSQAELTKTKQELKDVMDERVRIAELEAQAAAKLETVHGQLLQAGVDKQESEKEAKMKNVLADLSRVFSGVRGRVVDLVKPSARKYETAIQVILGRNIDAVVVEEEKTAIECIDYLRAQRSAHMTFIPLDTIQMKAVNDKFRTFSSKGAKLAIDLVEFDPSVERAIQHACGNALICDTMDVARYVCYEKGVEVKAVTLDGTVIHKSGLITGGRSTHGKKTFEETDVKGLQRTKDNLVADLRELGKQKLRVKSDEHLRSGIQRLEGVLSLAKDELGACKLRIRGIQDEIKHLDREIKSNSPELKKAQKNLTNLSSQIDTLQVTVDSAEDGVFKSFCRKIKVANIREYEERQLKVAQEESEARLRYEGQIARLGHQAEFEAESMDATTTRLDKIDSSLENSETQLMELRGQKSDLEREVKEIEESIESMQEEHTTLNEALEEKSKGVEKSKKVASKASKEVEGALKNTSMKNDEIEKLAIERSSIYRKCRLEEIRLPLVEGNLKDVSMEENLKDDVAMDVDEDEDGAPQVKRVEDWGIEVDFSSIDDDERNDNSTETYAKLDSDISKLNGEIERMAPNMKATDRLDEVEGKLAATEKEADKARKESRSARDNFNDVKKRRFDLFNKAYTHISDRIDQVYKDLTKGKASPMGGVAYLSLEDPEEPYAAGIKYHAMPPMKRFRDMEQLSGGEKTVAALALLFAIHSYQPAPFFVLDEVDAALDNTNVAKVANYIRTQASEAFQFIVISLKGSLYERGNSLVGIYRDQDINSSKTLTLDLTQYDD